MQLSAQQSQELAETMAILHAVKAWKRYGPAEMRTGYIRISFECDNFQDRDEPKVTARASTERLLTMFESMAREHFRELSIEVE